VDQAIEGLRMIQEIIGSDADLIRIPADQALRNLPAELKGPEWSDEGLTRQTLEVDRVLLLEQLKKGRVSYPASDLAAVLPPGWIRPLADMLIELPLPAVVAAMPSGELRGADRVDEDVMAASSMRDYFQRTTPEPEPVPEIPPEPEPVPEPEVQTPEVSVPTEWPDTGISALEPSGIEAASVEAAPSLAVPEVQPLAAAEVAVPVTGEGPTLAIPAEPIVPVPTPTEPPVPILPISEPTELPAPIVPVQTPAETPAPGLAAAVQADVRQVIASDLTPKADPDREASGWDGVERILDASAHAVDLNTVSATVLETLPGVGAFRAQLLIEFRKRNGPFAGIYDLLRIQGIGRRLFRQVTGLRPLYKNRRDRHEVLNELLGLPPDPRPSLGQIMQASCEVLGASASILSGADGVMLAQTGLDSLSADRYAAFTPNFFRKTRRYWPILGVEGIQQVLLPGAHPRALLHNGGGFSWVLLVPEGKDWNPLMERAAAIAEELNWLFSPHAVVRQIENAPANGQETVS
jgi:competence ComEA-like helix-hairpin-helix protein